MAFQFLILEECAREVLLDREQFYIGKFNAVHGGYNVLPIAGSSIGQKRTDETRAKISANVKKLSPKERERRRAVAAVTCADPEWRLKHSAMAKSLWTEERKRAWSVRMKKKFKDDPSLREKIRAARTGTKASKESREKQSAVRRGRKATLAHREAISRGLKGHFVSAETREKIRQANSGKTYRDSRQGILI